MARQAATGSSRTMRSRAVGRHLVSPRAPFRRSRSGRRPGPAAVTSCFPTPGAARRALPPSPGRRASSSMRVCCGSSSPTPTDIRNQIPFIEERVRAQLRRFAVDVDGDAGSHRAAGSDRRCTSPATRSSPTGASVSSRICATLVDALEEFVDPEDGEPDRAGPAGSRWARSRRSCGASTRPISDSAIWCGPARAAASTDRRPRSRSSGSSRSTISASGSWSARCCAETFAEKERPGQRLPLSVVVLDELNKYAPREGHSPLKEMLIDIAQRGRSPWRAPRRRPADGFEGRPGGHGERRHPVAGRLDAAEAERSEYGWMLPSTRARARLLKPGTMVLSQPAIPVPLVVDFPFPPWATRKEEVDDGRTRSLRRPVKSPPHFGLARRQADRTLRPIGRVPRGASTRLSPIADDEEVDLVLHSGDLFDRPLPPVEALDIALDGLVRLSDGGRRPVVVIAGNHDSHRASSRRSRRSPQPRTSIWSGTIKRPDDGGVLDLATPGGPGGGQLLPVSSRRAGLRRVGADRGALQEVRRPAARRSPRRTAPTRSNSPARRGDVSRGPLPRRRSQGPRPRGAPRRARAAHGRGVRRNLRSRFRPVRSMWRSVTSMPRSRFPARRSPPSTPARSSSWTSAKPVKQKRVVIVDVEPGRPAAVRSVPLSAGRTAAAAGGCLGGHPAPWTASTRAYLDLTVDTAGPDPGLAERAFAEFDYVVKVRADYPRRRTSPRGAWRSDPLPSSS